MERVRPLAVNRHRDRHAGTLDVADVGQTVRLAGWMAVKRDHGKLLFVDLRDASGIVQLVCSSGEAVFETLSSLRVESVVSASGTVVARSEETVNPKLPTGHVEVRVTEVEVLSAADVLPFPVAADAEVSEEQRLRFRYLDIRRGPLIERLELRARAAQLVRRHLSERGFLEVQTPILTASSPEGARDFLVPSRIYAGEFYALPQAPQQFKQLLMISGVERYFQIAPCFRDEDSRADRSPGEFYQIDLEMAYATQEDVFAEVESLMVELVTELSGKRVSAPFPRITFADALARYGTDKPDLRFDLAIADLTAMLGGGTELPMFAEAPERGHAVRALLVPGGAGSRSRKWFDQFAESAKKAGVIGSWLLLDPAEPRGPLAKKLSEDERASLTKAVGAGPGDAVLTAVGPAVPASAVLGAQRSVLGDELGLADPDVAEFFWVVDFPLYEPDETTGGWQFSHNPFSMPQGGLEALQTRPPGEILAYQYDLVCNGVELSSGAVRNHLPEVMEAAFAIAGYGPDRVRSAFPALWNAFHYGAPPHAGIAPGFDRLLMLLEDQANLREVIAFPLNQTARDLMMGAPSSVSDAQLRDLHLKVVYPDPPA